MKKVLLFVVLFVGLIQVNAQQTISENFGNTSTNVSIASHTNYQNANLTFSGTGDVRNSLSSGVTGSNDANVLLNSSGEHITISGFFSNANCTSIQVNFSLRKSSNAEDGTGFGVSYSTDGSTFTSIGSPSISTGSGTTQNYVSYSLTLNSPPSGIVAFKFENTVGSEQFRLDAFEIVGMGTDCLLPVELSNISIQAKNNAAELTWTTAQEINNDYFAVQHSTDAREFTTIGEVAGAGNSSESLDYSFVHKTPAQGMNYYRLQQFDFDGHSTYHEVLSVNFDRKGEVSIYPNPAKENITVALKKEFANNGIVEVISQTGKVVVTQALAAQTIAQSINTADLAAGIYFVRIINGNEVITKRFVKK